MVWHEMFSKGMRHLGLKDGKIDVRDISFSLIFFFFGWSIVLPIFSIRINEITKDPFVTGLIFSIWGFVCLALDIPMGILSDRFNKKRMMQFALIGYVFVAYLYTVVNTIPILVILRLFHAFCGCVFWITSWGVIRQYSTKEHREEELGVYTTLRSVVEIFGPFIGAIVITLLSWTIPFYLLSIFCFFTFIAISALDIKTDGKRERGLFKDEIKDFFSGGRKIWGLLFGIVILFSIAAGFGSFIPIVMDDLGFTYTEISIVMSIGMTLPWAILAIPIGKYADKHGRVKTALWGFIITAIGFFVFHFSFDFMSVLLSSLVISVGFTLSGLTLNTLVGDMTVKGRHGGFTGLTEAPKDLSNIIGPILAGFYLPIIGMGNTVLIFSGICLVALPIFYYLMK